MKKSQAKQPFKSSKPSTTSTKKSVPAPKQSDVKFSVQEISSDYDSDFDLIDSSDEEAVAQLKAKKSATAKGNAPIKSTATSKAQPIKSTPKSTPAKPTFQSATEMSDDDFDVDGIDFNLHGDDDSEDWSDMDDEEEAQIIPPPKSIKTMSKPSTQQIKSTAPQTTTKPIKQQSIKAEESVSSLKGKNAQKIKAEDVTIESTTTKKGKTALNEPDLKPTLLAPTPANKRKQNPVVKDEAELPTLSSKKQKVKNEEVKVEEIDLDEDEFDEDDELLDLLADEDDEDIKEESENDEDDQEEVDDEEIYGWKLNTKEEQESEEARLAAHRAHFKALCSANDRKEELRKQMIRERQFLAKKKRALRRHNSNLTEKLAIQQNYRPHLW